MIAFKVGLYELALALYAKWRRLVAAEEIGALPGRSKFCYATRGHLDLEYPKNTV